MWSVGRGFGGGEAGCGISSGEVLWVGPWRGWLLESDTLVLCISLRWLPGSVGRSSRWSLVLGPWRLSLAFPVGCRVTLGRSSRWSLAWWVGRRVGYWCFLGLGRSSCGSLAFRRVGPWCFLGLGWSLAFPWSRWSLVFHRVGPRRFLALGWSLGWLVGRRVGRSSRWSLAFRRVGPWRFLALGWSLVFHRVGLVLGVSLRWVGPWVGLILGLGPGVGCWLVLGVGCLGGYTTKNEDNNNQPTSIEY